MSLSTLRPHRDSLASLTEDSLLVILEHFSVPQLLVLLSVSKKMYHIIVQYILPRYRTILLPVHNQLLKQSVYFSRRYLSHSTLYMPALFSHNNERQPKNCIIEQLFKSNLSSFPIFLPRLLSRLQCFTFYYLFEENGLLNSEEAHVNGLLTVYLQSTWSETLVSLKLYFGIGTRPPADGTFFFEQFDQLHALRHLFLHFVLNDNFTGIHLPDSIPVFGQLFTLSLNCYMGDNLVKLLQQLSPNLTFLGLSVVNCYPQDIVTFLSNRPSYKKTLTTLELNLNGLLMPITGSQLSTLIGSCPFLQRFFGPFLVEGDLFTFFSDLASLSQLQEVFSFGLTVRRLRSLRDTYPLHRLPTLPSIRRLTLIIRNYETDWRDFQASELFDGHLPLLGAIFCAAENVEINFAHIPSQSEDSVHLSENMAAKMKEHFPSVRKCTAKYRSCRMLLE